MSVCSSYSFASITFGDGFFQFQHNKVSLKQAADDNHENTIFQPASVPLLKSINYVRSRRHANARFVSVIRSLLPLCKCFYVELLISNHTARFICDLFTLASFSKRPVQFELFEKLTCANKSQIEFELLSAMQHLTRT